MSAIAHTFNNTVISLQPEDGYVDATAMCQANGKLFADYFRLKTTKDFLEELSSVMGIPISQLVESRKGNTRKFEQGTWIHPKVAIHLAQWCSPKFAVFVTELVFDWMTGTHPSAFSPHPSENPFLHPDIQHLHNLLITADLKRAEMLVLLLLYRSHSEGVVFPTLAAMATALGMGRSTVSSAMSRLNELGLVEVQKQLSYRLPQHSALSTRQGLNKTNRNSHDHHPT